MKDTSTAAATAPLVRSLGYLGLTAPDLARWRSFAEEVCGLQIAPQSTQQQLLLRADARAWRICVVPGDGEMAYAGWEVAGAAELEQLSGRLERAGAAPVPDADLAAERQVTDLVRVQDPAGNRLEFFYGAKTHAEPFVSPRGVSFVTGEQGLGHVVLAVSDVKAVSEFYLDTLGFQVSDRIALGPAYALFMHVNARHHSLALLPERAGPGLHHFMLEARELDSVGYALDRVLAGHAPLTASLGRHVNDHMVSFYCQTPSRCEVEYGWNGLQIDEMSWVTGSYDTGSLWGHHHARVPQ